MGHDVLQVAAAGDAGEGEDGGHAQAPAAEDVCFDIVADQDAAVGLDAQAMAEAGEEDLVGFAAEDRRHIGGVGKHGGQSAGAKLDAPLAGVAAVGRDADEFSALAQQVQPDTQAFFGGIGVGRRPDDHGIARLAVALHPIDQSGEHFLDALGGQIEHARMGAVFGDHIVGGGGGGGVDVAEVDLHAHAQQPAHDPQRAGGAVRQAGESAMGALEILNQIDRAGERVFFVVDGPVEVEQDGVVVVEQAGHAASVETGQGESRR